MDERELFKVLRYSFSDVSLLKTALTHSSFANEHHCQSNERLEFLGDSILGMVTAEHLYSTFPNWPEGRMTKIRADLVCRQSLATVAERLNLGKYLRLGHGEESTGGRERPSLIADCTEAVIAAIYLDGGFDEASGFIHREILDRADFNSPEINRDCKTELQEIVQICPENVLTYELLHEEGPDHRKIFTIAVMLNGNEIGRGTGCSKKEAEQFAAQAAIEQHSAELRKKYKG